MEGGMSKEQRGGKRKGAGRKPAPAGTVKVPYGTKLDPEVVEYLKSRENAAATIEGTLKRSKDYKQWKVRKRNQNPIWKALNRQ